MLGSSIHPVGFLHDLGKIYMTRDSGHYWHAINPITGVTRRALGGGLSQANTRGLTGDTTEAGSGLA